MANINQIEINGVTYDIEDAGARADVIEVKSVTNARLNAIAGDEVLTPEWEQGNIAWDGTDEDTSNYNSRIRTDYLDVSGISYIYYQIISPFRIYVFGCNTSKTVMYRSGWLTNATGWIDVLNYKYIRLVFTRAADTDTPYATSDDAAANLFMYDGIVTPAYINGLVSGLSSVAFQRCAIPAIQEGATVPDLDDCGFGFTVLSSTVLYTHSPLTSAAPSHVLTYLQNGGTYKIQYFYKDWPATEIYMRRCSSGTWTSWEKVYSAADMTTLENTASTYRNLPVDFDREALSAQAENDGLRLRVMSYNICQYNNDTATYISDEKLLNLRKMFESVNADILMLQEDRAYIDANNQQKSLEYVYQPVYPYPASDMGGPTVRAKTHENAVNILKFTDNLMLLRYAVYNLANDVKLLAVSAHMLANLNGTGYTSEETIAARAAEYEELFQWVTGQITLKQYGTDTDITVPTHTHCIIGIDSNAITEDDWENLMDEATDAQFIAGNGGALGRFYTELRPVAAIGTDRLSLDNIFVSSNVIINKIEAWSDWYGRLYSDHVPVVADLTLTGVGSPMDRINGLESKIPAAPATDGEYKLTVTVSSGTASYSWTSAT